MSLEQRLEEVRLLHRSETLAAVFKPSGLLVHNSAWAGPREPSLAERVRALLDQEAHPLGRLDRGTSGVVWFGLSRDHYAAQHEALAQPSALKRYGAGGRVEACSRIAPLWQARRERASFVEVVLESGRRHQVRLHLKHLSHPVIGDANYGKGPINRHFAESYGLSRLALHCFEVAFDDPVSGERMQAEATLPPDLEQPFALLR